MKKEDLERALEIGKEIKELGRESKRADEAKIAIDEYDGEDDLCWATVQTTRHQPRSFSLSKIEAYSIISNRKEKIKDTIRELETEFSDM